MSFRTALITALAAAAVAAPVAEARPIDPPLAQDFRGPDARPAPEPVQDLRSPDARDARREPAAAPPPAATPPATAPVRATDTSGDDFPWVEAALVATLVGGAAGAARWRFRPATTG